MGLLRVAVLQLCVLLAACSAATPEELLSQARTAIAAQEYRTAEIHLKNLLQQQPDNAEARGLLGEVLLETGDLPGAEQSLRMAVQRGAEGAAEVSLLRALVGQAKFKESLEYADARALPKNPGDTADVSVLRGAAHRGLREPERAVEVYRAALATTPDALDIRTELASTLFALGRQAEGRELVSAVLVDDPNYSPALLLRAGLETAAGDRAAAEATLQQVVELERPNAARSQRYFLAMAPLIEVQTQLGKNDAAAANADALLALNPGHPLARYAKALVEIAQGDLAGAEQRLEDLVADAPQYWPAHRLLGAINLRQDQLGQAAMYLQAAVNNDPADSAARLQLAELYVRQGNLDAARTLMEGTPGGVRDDVFLAFAAGASQRAGLEEQASELFDRLEQQSPTDIQQLVGLSSVYTAAGEFERAVRVLQSSNLQGDQNRLMSDYLLALVRVRQGDLESADGLAEKLQGEYSQAAWPLNLRGVIALMRGDTAGARRFIERGLELEPRSVASLLNMSRVAVAERDTEGAEGYLRQALEVDPAEPAALLGLAQFSMARRDYAAARALIERAPQSSGRMLAEADLLGAEQRFGEAADLFAQVFAAQPSSSVAIRAYESARRAGRANADAQLRRWHADHPDDSPTSFALASVELEGGNLPEAERLYESVIATNPNHAATLNNLAWIYGERRDPRALELGERALTAAPDNPSIADTVGWLYVQNGNATRGLPLLARAAGALPEELDVHYHWAVALAETGDTAGAVDILQRLTRDDRQFASRADAERRLNALRTAR